MVLSPFKSLTVGDRKKSCPCKNVCWDRIVKTYPVVPPGLTRPSTRPLCAYHHMPAFVYGEPPPSPILRRTPFLLALRSPFRAALSAAIPPPAALCRRGCRCVLTLPQRFSRIVAQDFSFVNTFLQGFLPRLDALLPGVVKYSQKMGAWCSARRRRHVHHGKNHPGFEV